MKSRALEGLGLAIARARIVLSLLVLVSIYIDRSTGGLFGIGRAMLLTLVIHLAYGLTVYAATKQRLAFGRGMLAFTAAIDLTFASALAAFTEGPTSPAFAMFLFAITATGCWGDLRSILAVTISSVILYLAVIALASASVSNPYLMRAAYLGIAGYVIDFFARQRQIFEARVRELEAEADRHLIARSLHDGYIQALAGISLKLESCRDMLGNSQPVEALTEIREIQAEVSREYDDVRKYVRSLTGVQSHPIDELPRFATEFHLHAAFVASGSVAQHLIQIVLESMRNIEQHAHARSATIQVQESPEAIRITIDDDGIGFGTSADPPWTIASRVAEFGGRLAIKSNHPGAHLEIAIPTV